MNKKDYIDLIIRDVRFYQVLSLESLKIFLNKIPTKELRSLVMEKHFSFETNEKTK